MYVHTVELYHSFFVVIIKKCIALKYIIGSRKFFIPKNVYYVMLVRFGIIKAFIQIVSGDE